MPAAERKTYIARGIDVFTDTDILLEGIGALLTAPPAPVPIITAVSQSTSRPGCASAASDQHSSPAMQAMLDSGIATRRGVMCAHRQPAYPAGTWAAGPRGLDIAVTDGGARTTPEVVEAGVSDVSGRGLSIVESLSTRWWVETSRSRTTVHALVALA